MHNDILAADQEWLRARYIDEKLSVREIAELIGYSKRQTSHILRKYAGIKLRNNSDRMALFRNKKKNLI